MASAAAAGGGGGPDGTGRGPALTGSLPPGAPSVVFGLQNYIDKMIKTKDTGPGAIPGMKILILDKDTVRYFCFIVEAPIVPWRCCWACYRVLFRY